MVANTAGMGFAVPVAAFVEHPAMSISALGSLTTAAASLRRAASATASSGFGAQVAVAVGKGHGAHGARTQQADATEGAAQTGGAATAAPARTLADDTRALVGDVFGALGANTPSAVTAQQAIAAYRQTG